MDRLSALFAPRSVLVLHQNGLRPQLTPHASLQVEYRAVDEAGRFEKPLTTFDLALVFVDAAVVLTVLRLLCDEPCARAVVMPGRVEVEVSDAAHVIATQAGVALLGPHAFGLQLPHLGLNASEMPLAAAGNIALLSQSSSLTAAMLDWASDHQIGFSIAASCGVRGEAGLAGLLDYCAVDPQTHSIVVYLDDIATHRSQVRRFMSALRAAASAKPVVVLKPTGRGTAADLPVMTLAQDEAVITSALARAGAVRVYFFIQLFSALKLLAGDKQPAGRRLAILSNSNGAARLAQDWGVRVKVSTTRVELARHVSAEELTSTWAHQIAQTAKLQEVDALMLLLTPRAEIDSACAQVLAQELVRCGKPVLACVLGDAQGRMLRQVFERAHVPALRTPESAVDGFGNLATFHYNQELLRQIPPPVSGSVQIKLKRCAALLAQARVDGVTELSGNAAIALLRALGVSRETKLPSRWDTSSLHYVHELRIEAHTHRLLGPILSFGASGPAGSTHMRDQASELAPLNRLLAQRLIERSRVFSEIAQLHDSELVFVQLQNILLTLSEALCEFPELVDLVIDPIRLVSGRMRITDASVRLSHTQAGAAIDRYAHMAIHPYPSALAKQVRMRSGAFAGTDYLLRPIRPEDAFGLQAFIRSLSTESRYMRFISHMRELSTATLVRYTQIDYDRELAFVAVLPEGSTERVIGLAHWIRRGDETAAEYALAVADGYQRQGIGSALMRALEAQALEKRLAYLEGFVLAENQAMLALMRHLGYRVEGFSSDASLRRVYKTLK